MNKRYEEIPLEEIGKVSPIIAATFHYDQDVKVWLHPAPSEDNENNRMTHRQTLREIVEVCGTVNFSSHIQMREAIESSMSLAEEALLTKGKITPQDDMTFAEWTQEQKWKWFPAHKRWERNEKKVYRNKFVQKTTLELHALYTASLTK